MPWAVVIHWTRCPAPWAEALDTCPRLVQCRDEMERYNVRQLWGPRCERCRIYCDIYDFDEILQGLRDGVIMTNAKKAGLDHDLEELSATECQTWIMTLADWTTSCTVCAEEYLDEMMQCIPNTVRNQKRAKPNYIGYIYLR